MTFPEKYEELYKKYLEAGSVLTEATEKLAELNGFGGDEMKNYASATIKYGIAQKQYNLLLEYVTNKDLNPNSEFVAQEFMIETIAADQKKRRVSWDDENRKPNCIYECTIEITNNGEYRNLGPLTEYKFPVMSLEHGIECSDFLVGLLQEGGEQFGAIERDFSKINKREQIYVSVKLRTF